MQFKMKVQYLGHNVNASNLHCYDFLELDSNLPFTIYSLSPIDSYNKFEQYHNYEPTFELVLSKTKEGIKFKVKGV